MTRTPTRHGGTEWRPWTRTEERLLGRKTDNEVAAIIGRSADPVRLHRKLLGIPIKPEYRPWTAREEDWWGRLHDEEIARHTGRTRQAVHCYPRFK